MKPSTLLVTSTETTQSVLWYGTVGEIELKKVTQFNNDAMYFTTSVVIKNIGSVPLSDMYYMRTVDPDQEVQFYKTFKTRNYVKYRRDTSEYVNPAHPDMNLVCAMGNNNHNFFVGLGTIDSRAVVSHFGFQVFNPAQAYTDNTWRGYGGNDMLPDVEHVSRMRDADEAIHLVYKFPLMQPGELVSKSKDCI